MQAKELLQEVSSSPWSTCSVPTSTRTVCPLCLSHPCQDALTLRLPILWTCSLLEGGHLHQRAVQSYLTAFLFFACKFVCTVCVCVCCCCSKTSYTSEQSGDLNRAKLWGGKEIPRQNYISKVDEVCKAPKKQGQPGHYSVFLLQEGANSPCTVMLQLRAEEKGMVAEPDCLQEAVCEGGAAGRAHRCLEKGLEEAWLQVPSRCL